MGAFWLYNSNKATHNTAILTSSETTKSTTISESDASVDSTESSTSVTSQVASESTEDTTVVDQKNVGLKPAPPVTFEDVDGNTVSLAELKGKPVLITFWASWCPPCREELPYFDTAFQEYGDQLEFVVLNATGSQPSEDIETAKAFIEEFGMSAPVYYDTKRLSQAMFGVTLLPSTMFINSDGYVFEGYRGEMSEALLHDKIKALLAAENS